jgi:hypothetical protein
MAVRDNGEFEDETEEAGGESEHAERTEKPWEAKLIRVDQKVYSIRQIMDMIDGSLDLNPSAMRTTTARWTNLSTRSAKAQTPSRRSSTALNAWKRF